MFTTSFYFGAYEVPVAHIFARPYPTMDNEPGAFNGEEQFASAQTAIVFWGNMGSLRNPKEAAEIRAHGVEGVRKGTAGRIYDPVIVLGVRTVAHDLAKVFVAKRSQHLEDYRGAFHTTFLIERTSKGKVPRSLLRMKEDELAQEFEKRILWMETHNVHRPTEGGGYANESFLNVLTSQATEEMKVWPEISRQSTEIYRQHAADMTSVMQTSGQSALVEFEGKSMTVNNTLSEVMRRLVLATRRERMNYDTYEPSMLQEVTAALHKSIDQRKAELDTMERASLLWLANNNPTIATTLQ